MHLSKEIPSFLGARGVFSIKLRDFKNLTVNTKFFSGRQLKHKLLSISELDSGYTKTVLISLRAILDRNNIFDKVALFCTDGAPAMLSEKKNEVTDFLKRPTKTLIGSHCNSHKLNLRISGTWKADVHLQSMNKFIFKLCTLFSRSTNNTKILET